jgi:hypothetical protein
MQTKFYPICITVFVCIIGCGAIEYSAQWIEKPITIDAGYSDWQGNLASAQEGKISYGFQRDSSYFYICLIVTNEQVQRQIMMRGLEMHFDPNGETNQRVSIKYPLGMMASGRPMMDMMRPSMTRSAVEPPDILFQFQNSLGELEIRNSEEETYKRLALAELPGLGLGVKASAETGEWICEMRIPLGSAGTFKYALGRADVSFIKVNLKTPEMDLSAMRAQMPERGGGGMPGGGGGMGGGGMPPGGGPPGGGGPQGGGQGSDTSDEFKASFKVILEG